MDTLKEKNTDYEKVIDTASKFMIDLVCQICNLAMNIKKQTGEISHKQYHEMINLSAEISIRAYKTSVIMLMFDTLETISNFISELILMINDGIDGSPQAKYHVNQIEIDLLKEQKTYIDCKTGKIKVNKSNFIPTMDKLVIVPFLLGKIYDLDFKIDTSGKGWQGILKLKQLRDQLTHPKFNLNLSELDNVFSLDINNVKPAVSINNMELFQGAESIRWYWAQIKKLFETSGLFNSKFVNHLFISIDMLLWLMLLNLSESCGIKEFDKKYPNPLK